MFHPNRLRCVLKILWLKFLRKNYSPAKKSLYVPKGDFLRGLGAIEKSTSFEFRRSQGIRKANTLEGPRRLRFLIHRLEDRAKGKSAENVALTTVG
jgi:hypothetical protein